MRKSDRGLPSADFLTKELRWTGGHETEAEASSTMLGSRTQTPDVLTSEETGRESGRTHREARCSYKKCQPTHAASRKAPVTFTLHTVLTLPIQCPPFIHTNKSQLKLVPYIL